MTVRETFIEILVEQLDADPLTITDDTTLVDDLGADSLDEVELLMACEERFGIEIPDALAGEWFTVGQALSWLHGHGATVMPAPARGW